MGKICYVYRGFTRTQLKSRADIPDPGDITEVDAVIDYIDCVNIKMSDVSPLLTDATYSLKTVCTHANVNHWSGFGPTKRDVIGGVLVNRDPIDSEGYSLGSFAGYNHTAETPHYESVTHDDDQEVLPGSDATFSVQVYLGEPRLVDDDIEDVSDEDRGLALTVWDGANILTRLDTTQVIDIHDLKLSGSYLGGSDGYIVELVTTYTIPAGTTHALEYDCKIFLSKNLTSFDSDLSDAICKFTELPDYTKLFKVLVANHFWLNGPENLSSATGASTFTSGKWEVNGAQCVRVSDYVLNFSLNYVQLNANLLSGNHCVATVYVERGYYNASSIWVGTVLTTPVEIYDGVWNDSPDHLLAFSWSPATDIWDIGSVIDNSGYGYRYCIDCDVTIV